MNRYDIALGKKPPEAPLVQAMRKALDEPYTPTTTKGVKGESWPPTGESYASYYNSVPTAITPDLINNYYRIPATGDH